MELKTLGLEPFETKSAKVGQKFGRLTIRAIGRKPGTYRYIAVCDCACGKTDHLVRIDGLKNGSIASCGCGHIDSVTKHGRSYHPLWRKWHAMIERCDDPKARGYPHYGGRGIKVCARWRNVELFISDMEPGYFPGAELDRIDVNGNYEPENCRWLTHSEQAANKTTTIYLAYLGKTQRLIEWSQELGIPYGTIWDRIHSGWDTEKALSTPPMDADSRCLLARQNRGKL